MFRFVMRSSFAFRVCACAIPAAWLLFCAAARAESPAASDTLDLAPHWHVGEHVDYVLTKKGVVTSEGVTQVSTTNSTAVRVDVLKSDPAGYLVGWTMGKTQFDEAANAAMSPLMKTMANVMAGHQVKLRLDRAGHVLEVTNWQEIRAVSGAAAREMATLLARSGLDRSQIDAATGEFQALFSSEPKVRQASAREAQLLFEVLGHRYARSGPVVVDAVVPNPVGQGTVAVVQRFQLTRIDATAAFQWTESPAAGAAGLPGAAGHGLLQDDGLRVSGQAVVDIGSGWPATVSQTVDAAAGRARRTEVTSLQRQ